MFIAHRGSVERCVVHAPSTARISRGEPDGACHAACAGIADRGVSLRGLSRRAISRAGYDVKTSLRICDARPSETAKNGDHFTTKVSLHHGLVHTLQGY